MCNIVITMVADPAAMDAVLEGPTGVFAARFGGNLLINMSTVSVEYSEKLRKRCFVEGIRFIDCPVAELSFARGELHPGSKPLAENGTLVLLAAGEKKIVEEAGPILLGMGKSVVYAGPAPSGTALKLCMNLIVAGLTSALAESAILAERLGIDPKLIFSVIGESPALNCGYFKMKEENILKKDFSPAFPLKHMLKDARFILKEAAERGQRLPVTEAIEKLMAAASRTGDGDSDLSVILKTLAEEYRRT